jgi:hypothetical protein
LENKCSCWFSNYWWWAGANAQTNKPMAPQQGKEIHYSPSEKNLISNMANPYGTKG